VDLRGFRSYSFDVKRVYATVAAVVVLSVSGAGQAAAPGVSYWDPSWSPRANTIAFVDRGDTPGDLYTVDASGSHLRKITASSYPPADNYGARDPTWSPDGKKIVFGYGYDGISVIRPDGLALTQIRKDGAMPAWSPHGRRIAFVAPDWPAASVWVMRPDGTGKTLVATPPRDDRSLFAPAWSPDGQLLAFCVGTAADSTVKPGYLAIINRYRGRFTRLLQGLNPSFVDWSPDGKRLAVAFDPVTNDPHGLANVRVGVFNLRTRHLRQLHFGAHPTWSPDGRRITFTDGRGIWVINTNGTGAHRITH
jgi:Tol biopolymer transport system component